MTFPVFWEASEFLQILEPCTALIIATNSGPLTSIRKSHSPVGLIQRGTMEASSSSTSEIGKDEPRSYFDPRNAPTSPLRRIRCEMKMWFKSPVRSHGGSMEL